MTEVDGTIIVAILQKMQGDIAELKADVREVKVRMTIVESHLAGVMASLGVVMEKSDRQDDWNASNAASTSWMLTDAR